MRFGEITNLYYGEGTLPLLPVERKDLIRDIIYEKKTVSISELSNQFGVSLETIRWDIDSLAQEGILTKTYGGAKFRPQVSKRAPASVLRNILSKNKNAMAAVAAQYVKPNDCIFLGYSTTVFALCAQLQNVPLTIVTNSLPVMQFFADSSNVHLECIGGQYLKDFDAFSSYSAIENLRRYSFDKAFLSCQAFNLNRGMCDQNDTICGLQQKVMEFSDQVYLLADHSKINQTAFISYGRFSDITQLITDTPPDKAVQEQLDAIGLPCVAAQTDPAELQ